VKYLKIELFVARENFHEFTYQEKQKIIAGFMKVIEDNNMKCAGVFQTDGIFVEPDKSVNAVCKTVSSTCNSN